jgi:hypothetical protein
MNPKLVELAQQAGFVLWQDEAWKPHNQVIDWSSDYDRELELFAQLVTKDLQQQNLELIKQVRDLEDLVRSK